MCFCTCENVSTQLFLVLLLVSVSIQRIPWEAVPGESSLVMLGAVGKVPARSVFVIWQQDALCVVLLPVWHLVSEQTVPREFPLLSIVLPSVTWFLVSFGVPGFLLESYYLVCFIVETAIHFRG